jgi:HEAT repeat protein
MKQSDLNEILKDLNSPYWDIRLNATSNLKKIKESADCLSLYRIIEKEDDSSLRFNFLQVLDDFILVQNGEIEGAALFCLVNYSQKENKKVSARAKKVIDSFIHSPNIIRYQKLNAVRMAWGLLTLEKRKFLTHIILTNKLTELVPLILANFKTHDSDLTRRTIDGLRLFGDSRGNQFIKLCLKDKNKPVRISAVKAIGNLGSVLDYKSIKRCLYDNDSAIQIAAVGAYGKLLGRFAYDGLIDLFHATEKVPVKKEILNHFGKQRTQKSLRFIVDHYLKEEDSNISLYCEWALYESRYSKKVRLLLRTYRGTDLAGKYKLLGFLGGLYDSELIEFYVDIVKSKPDPLLTMTVIDSLSNYNDSRSIDTLSEVLGDFKGDYSTYALLSLMKIREVDAAKIIEDFIANKLDRSHSGHEVILKALKTFHLNIENTQEVTKYLCEVISIGKLSQKVLALETAHFFEGREIYTTILKVRDKGQSSVVQEAIDKALVKLVSIDPELLDFGFNYLDDPSFSEVFQSKKADTNLLRKIGLIFSKRALDFGVHFLYLHGRNLTQRFISNISLYEDDEHIDFYLSYMDKHEIGVTPKQILLLQREFYQGATNARKLSILSLSCLTPDQRNFSFFYDKVNELFKDNQMRHELVGYYMRGLCE